MGGQNHQPYNRIDTSYLVFSTMMSRAVSCGRSRLERANMALEDVLIMELRDGKIGRLDGVIKHLNASDSAIGSALEAITNLREEMNRHNFEDLPTAKTVDFESLGEDLFMAGMIQPEAWNVLEAQHSENGFYGILDYFSETLDKLHVATNVLRSAILDAEPAAMKGILNLTLEENSATNFKVEFAQLYTAWERFQAVFLASSMYSTELWYQHCGVGSLLNKLRKTQAA